MQHIFTELDFTQKFLTPVLSISHAFSSFPTMYLQGFTIIQGSFFRARPCAISAYFLQMAHRKSDKGADPAHKFSGKNLLGSEFILHKNVGIHLPSTA